MQEPSSPVNPPEVGIRVHKSSETGLPGEPFSLTSLWRHPLPESTEGGILSVRFQLHFLTPGSFLELCCVV